MDARLLAIRLRAKLLTYKLFKYMPHLSGIRQTGPDFSKYRYRTPPFSITTTQFAQVMPSPP